ncbi:inner membrane protein YbjM [Brenneria populi subsp. brevivirga]|uniref:Inner membrane protein YbjM n=1 Tax=Brenneria populi TaxID=1505588 RepID=A0ABU6JMK9_9GAMM|nr:inner membrane protein YbjM [Brenneria populi subsp. brevivirga]MEC5341866.1 inner membrane protein YbjM [Brenneria populi Li et al. 2015]
MANDKGWMGAACCFLLFTVVFLSQKMNVPDVVTDDGLRGDPGMLLFLLPGVAASCLSARGRLLYPLIGALIAMPVCLLILHFGRAPNHSFWQELAYISSAVFWSVLGALGMLCFHATYRRYFH